MGADAGARTTLRNRRLSFGWAAVVTAALLAGCGDAPLTGIGDGASEWIGEPTIVTTTTIPVTVPKALPSHNLKWFNDTIETEALGDPAALLEEVFRRRGGDLIVQASRAEIVALLPEIKFLAAAPYQAEYVTSQLVFEGSGLLSKDPVAGFGFWSSEPYTRSRSVAQVATLWVSEDPEAAQELSEPGADISCGRFASRVTERCAILEMGDVPVWTLDANNGTTYVWFDGVYRYELFARSLIPPDAMSDVVPSLMPLAELVPASS